MLKWRQNILSSESKNTGIILGVTKNFNESLVDFLKKSVIASDLKAKGYSLDKTVLGRFGYLLVCQQMELLSKNPDLLLASSSMESSEEKLLKILKEIKN